MLKATLRTGCSCTAGTPECCLHDAGGDAVDAHTTRAQLHGHRRDQAKQCRLGDRVGAEAFESAVRSNLGRATSE